MNQYSEVMGQEATSFSQARLTTLVSQTPALLRLPIPGGLRATEGIEPLPRTEMPLCSFLEALQTALSGSQRVLGKLCRLLGPLYLTFTIKMDHSQGLLPGGLACFPLNNLALDPPQALELGSNK